MTSYTKHNGIKKPERTKDGAAQFGFLRRAGIPYSPRMTDKEKRELLSRR